MQRCSTLLAAAVAASALPAAAQVTADRVAFPGRYAPGSAPCVAQPDGSCTPVSQTAPLPTAAKQEALQLASANVAAVPASVYGGSYVLMQSCASYNSGSLTLRYRGPDGATMTPLIGKTASDANGGTLVSLGSATVVDATLPAGSSGCNVTLARVPQ